MGNKLEILFIMSILIITMETGHASESANESETYSGVIISTLGQTASKSINVTIQIDKFTTDQEVMNYQIILEGKGKVAVE